MVVNRKPTGRASSVPAGLAWSGAVSLGAILLGSALVAALVDRETLAKDHMGYGIMAVLLAASWLGAKTAVWKIRRRRTVMCLASGAVCYGSLLLITALFFGGRYSGAGETGLLVLCGSLLGAFRFDTGKSGRKPGKIRIPHG